LKIRQKQTTVRRIVRPGSWNSAGEATFQIPGGIQKFPAPLFSA
jgi:hypothetical protein